METTEKIVEAYARYVKGWATIPNIRCGGQFEIDLLAIDLVSGDRYHIETSISVSPSFSKLTETEYNRGLHKPTMRRTVDYFLKQKFEARSVTDTLQKYGFGPGQYKRVIATWDATEGAKAAASKVGIELLYFRDVVRGIAQSIAGTRGYFADDTLRTMDLYARALGDSMGDRKLCN